MLLIFQLCDKRVQILYLDIQLEGRRKVEYFRKCRVDNNQDRKRRCRNNWHRNSTFKFDHERVQVFIVLILCSFEFKKIKNERTFRWKDPL